MPIGIIGGTGFSQLPEFDLHREEVTTAFGAVTVLSGSFADKEVVFLPRHGAAGRLAPHQIAYQANIAALQSLGCTHILATNAVGGIREDIEPGHLVVPDQFLDFTRQRPLTLAEGSDEEIPHIDVTNPYCSYLRRLIAEQAWEAGLVVHQDVVYVCTEGPRFETPAEIQMFAQLGGDVVGMTGVPEVVLAREAEICYASVGVVTNYAAGISGETLSADEVHELMGQIRPDLLALLTEVTIRLDPQADCLCPFK